MKIRTLLTIALLSFCSTTMLHAQEKKFIKGFSGGMMVHSGYQYGGDNPFGLDISSPTFGIGGCAKLNFTDHFRAGFEGYFSTAPIKKGAVSGSHNKLFCFSALFLLPLLLFEQILKSEFLHVLADGSLEY